MSAFAIVIKKPEVWTSYFDNTRWTGGAGTTWDGSKWVSSGASNYWVYLIKTGSWYLGYRPTKVRFTMTNVATDVDLQVNSDHYDLVDDPNTVSLKELTLDFSGGEDIDSIIARNNSVGVWQCTNIEFLEP